MTNFADLSLIEMAGDFKRYTYCHSCLAKSELPLADGWCSRTIADKTCWECPGCTDKRNADNNINRYVEQSPRPLTDGREKSLQTGFVDWPLWVDKDDCDKPLGGNRG